MTSSGDWSIAGNGILRTNTAVEIATANAIPAGGTARAGVTFWSATNFGILPDQHPHFPPLGAHSISGVMEALTTRAYINTDGDTTWTVLVSVG